MKSSMKMTSSKLSTSNRRGLLSSSSTSSRVKMKIKPFKKPPAPPADLYDSTFSLLLSATNAILRKQPLVARPTYSSISSSSANEQNTSANISNGRSASPTSVAPPSSMRDENEFVPISKEELYRGVEDLCVHGYSNKLYLDVCKILETGALFCLRKLTDEKSSTWAMGAVVIHEQVVFHSNLAPFSNDSRQVPQRTLNCAQQVYSDYLEYLTFVRSIFLYLDRTFVFGKTKVKTLWDVGIDVFRRYTMYDCNSNNNENSSQEVKYSNIIQTLIQVTLQQIRSEREGEVVDRALLRNTIRMFADIPGCFYDHFIPQFIAESMTYFENEGIQWMQNSSSGTASEFLAHVEKRWTQANDMSIYYLDCSTAQVQNMDKLKSSQSLRDLSLQGKDIASLLASVVEQKLLLPHVESFLLKDKHLYPLLNDDSKLVPDLKRLYILLRRVSKLDELRVAFGRYGRITGTKIVEGNPMGDMNNASTTGSLIKDPNKDIIFNLLMWKDRLETIHRVAFMNDDSFGFSVTLHPLNKSAATSHHQTSQKAPIKTASTTTSCLRGVLEDVLNGSSLTKNRKQDAHEYGKRVAELLAKYVDLCLRSTKTLALPKSSNPSISSSLYPSSGLLNNQLNSTYTSDGSLNKLNKSDPEQLLEKIMSMFRHLQSKDIFEAFFKRDLAKRLLLKRSVSIDLEKLFISKLKTECGTGYTSKMEGMFKDMDLSKEVMERYSIENLSMREKKQDLDIDIDVQILTTGYWPVYGQLENLKLPPTLQVPLSSFESYYKKKYQGRRIVWQHSLGNCHVEAHFPNGTKDLFLSLYQTMVLVLCFNDWDDNIDENNLGKGWTISEVMAMTGIDDKDECERVLQSLSIGKEGAHVLIKRDPQLPVTSLPHSKKRTKHTKERKSVLPTDVFHYNHNFTSRHNRIKITSIQMRETTQEREDTQQSVSRDRLYLIDAAVVRIMKARKTISHQELLGEVMNQLRFPATSSDIKNRIGGLIDREYMERSDDDIDKYNYLA